jgi:hypothetical protein
MLYREVIATCSEIRNNHRNKVCWQIIEFFNTEPGGTWSTHWDLRGSTSAPNIILFCVTEFVISRATRNSHWINTNILLLLYNKTNSMHQFPKFTPALNSICFGQFLCSSSWVYSLYTRYWYMSYRFEDSFRAGQDGTPFHPGPAPKYTEFHAVVNLVNWGIWLVLL